MSYFSKADVFSQRHRLLYTRYAVMLLALIVYHSDWILMIYQKQPCHPFNSISILSSPFLVKLKKNSFMMELNKHVSIATGISSHIKQLYHIQDLKNMSAYLKEDVKEFCKCL